jgi:hypothetical protein
MTPTDPRIDMAVAERRLAEAAVVADIETNGLHARDLGQRVWDVRAMTDPREHCPQVVDMTRQALAYAEWRGLIRVVERMACGAPAIVRVLRNPG